MMLAVWRQRLSPEYKQRASVATNTAKRLVEEELATGTLPVFDR